VTLDVITAGEVKEAFPNIDWARFEDIDLALTWDLLWGPMPEDYWVDHYEWKGFLQASDDIEEVLSDLPGEVWVCDGLLELSNPDDNEDNWLGDEEDPYAVWVGPEYVTVVDPRKLVMHEATYNQVF
jgi:hypothetical protein